MRGTNLSEETTITINDDGSAVLEVIFEDDVAAIHLTPAEVAHLLAFLLATLGGGDE